MFLQGSRHSNYSTHFEEAAAAAIMVSTASASTFWRQLCVSTMYDRGYTHHATNLVCALLREREMTIFVIQAISTSQKQNMRHQLRR